MKKIIISMLFSWMVLSCTVTKITYRHFHIGASEYRGKINYKDSGNIVIDLKEKIVYLHYKGYLSNNENVVYKFHINDSFYVKNLEIYRTEEKDYFEVKISDNKIIWYTAQGDIIIFIEEPMNI